MATNHKHDTGCNYVRHMTHMQCMQPSRQRHSSATRNSSSNTQSLIINSSAYTGWAKNWAFRSLICVFDNTTVFDGKCVNSVWHFVKFVGLPWQITVNSKVHSQLKENQLCCYYLLVLIVNLKVLTTVAHLIRGDTDKQSNNVILNFTRELLITF